MVTKEQEAIEESLAWFLVNAKRLHLSPADKSDISIRLLKQALLTKQEPG